ncbi:unnamed protein product, partial [marine sediment metagenome]
MAKKKKGHRRPKPSLIMLVSIFAGLYGTYAHVKGHSGETLAGRL